MEERMKWLLSFVCGCIATFAKQYGLLIVLVLLAILLDVITGLCKAKITGEGIDSTKGTKGFFKKVSLLVALFFGFFLDFCIPMMCEKVSIVIPFNTPFALIICFYIVLNECISICENLYACNPDIMPAWIVKLLKQAKEKINNEVDNEDISEK